MNPAKREAALLLRDLRRPPEAIAANCGMSLQEARLFVRSGALPVQNQQRQFTWTTEKKPKP